MGFPVDEAGKSLNGSENGGVLFQYNTYNHNMARQPVSLARPDFGLSSPK